MPVDPQTLCWTPRGTFTRVGKRLSPPKTTRMPPPRQPRQISKRTITTLTNDPESVTMLEGLIKHWLAEATRLEASIEDQTLTEKMARLMFEVDVPLRIQEQEALWDPNGGGTVSKGEFRLHIAAVGIEEVGVEDVDALFDRWDVDRSGQLDMDELAAMDEAEEPLSPVDREWKKRLGRKRDKAERLASSTQANGLTFTENRKRRDILVRLFDTIAAASGAPLTEVSPLSLHFGCSLLVSLAVVTAGVSSRRSPSARS